MSGWLGAWGLSAALSILFSSDLVASLSRSAWSWSSWHKNDAALFPILLAFLPWWMLAPGAALILVSGSRNAVLGLLVVVLARVNVWWRCLLIGIALPLLGAALVLHPEVMARGTARLGHWLVALQMFAAHPVLGSGPFTFMEVYLRDLPTSLPFGIVPEVALIPWAHNLYLEVLAERGLVGFAIFAGVIVWTLRHGPQRTRTAMVALLAMGLFDLTFLKAWVSLAFWGLAWTAKA